MKSRSSIVSCLLALVVVSGCASTKVTQSESNIGNQRLARPNNILIYDFAATPADVPADAAVTGQAASQTADDVAIGRQLGAQIAKELAAEIQAMGLPAAAVSSGATPQIGDIVIKGYFLSIDEGSAVKRVAVGFGTGAAELKTVVEGYQMTAQGLRKLGSGTVDAGGGKSPGAALGVAGLIATANPAGLIVNVGMKAYGEASGNSKVEGRARDTAKEIAEQLEPKFQQQGWIQ